LLAASVSIQAAALRASRQTELLPGTATSLQPMMLLAHIDVVEAKREDWQRDPFKLTEEEGYFYARGVADDKAMAAIFTDLKDARYSARS
jgi:acetylornithine deacetylase/succinyl-diaminopimelate desuccinylase-like protein